MDRATHMNYLALNQNVFNKAMIIGQGPQEGSVENPTETPSGIKVYRNGKHAMPEIEELEHVYDIGSLSHPQLMFGMPGCPGDLGYEFWQTETQYVIVIRLQLDEYVDEGAEPAADILAVAERSDIPDEILHSDNCHEVACKAMMNYHFQSLFDYYESAEELNDWVFQPDALHSLVAEYFNVDALIDIEDEDSDVNSDEDDYVPLKYFLPEISAYDFIDVPCPKCEVKTTFSGHSRLNTSVGCVYIWKYQCQSCGKLKGSAESHRMGVRVGLHERCECGGQYRRDKNIFCPSCSYRKSDENKSEKRLYAPKDEWSEIKERHGVEELILPTN